MDALITAGGAPASDDPLYPYTDGRPKSLLRLNGRPLVHHVITALQAAKEIDDILVIGLTQEQLALESPNVYTLPDQGSLLGNGLNGMRWLMRHRGEPRHIVLCSADIPKITAEMIDKTVAMCRPLDHVLYYQFVTRPVMETRFPNSARTFVKLKGVEVAGADLMVVHTSLAEGRDALWEALVNGRKHAWKLARTVGLTFLLKFLFRRVGLADIEATAARILDAPAKIILTPFAEMGMDIDKPTHIRLLEDSL